MVYFISDGKGHIKIGFTAESLQRRVSDLQVGTALRLRVLATIDDGDELLEKHLHRRFSHLRIAGEWFRAGHELTTYIAFNSQMRNLKSKYGIDEVAKAVDQLLSHK